VALRAAAERQAGRTEAHHQAMRFS